MKITEYPSVAALTDNNILLIDGPNGTKTISVRDAILSVVGLISPNNHRMIFRGKNLGSSVTPSQLTAIKNGSFDDLWIGDYWEIGGVKYRIADFDYWYNVGVDANKCLDHHVVIIPDNQLYTGVFNTTMPFTGGYLGSEVRATGLDSAKSMINSAFPGSVLTIKNKMYSNAFDASSNMVSGYATSDSTVELPNEYMIFGHKTFGTTVNGTTIISKLFDTDSKQLALFAHTNEFLVTDNGFHLRDILSTKHNSQVSNAGAASYTQYAQARGIRPVFAIG